MIHHLLEKVETLSGQHPIFIGPGETLRRATQVMWEEGIGVLIVGEHGIPHGMLSERDIITMLGKGGDLDRTTVHDAMTPYVVAVQVGDQLSDAAFRMLEEGIRHVPVREQAGPVVGMLSVLDLLRPLLLDALERSDF